MGYEGNTMVTVSGSEASTYNSSISAGTGLAWSLNNGSTWNYIEQPIDIDCEDFSSYECLEENNCSWSIELDYCIYNNYKIIEEDDVSIPMVPIIAVGYSEELYSYPITVPEFNVIYDISIDLKNGYIYTANYYGMLRRFKFYDFINESIIPEPIGGAHRNTDQIIKNVGIAIRSSLKQVISLDKNELLNQRKTKYLMTFNKS